MPSKERLTDTAIAKEVMITTPAEFFLNSEHDSLSESLSKVEEREATFSGFSLYSTKQIMPPMVETQAKISVNTKSLSL